MPFVNLHALANPFLQIPIQVYIIIIEIIYKIIKYYMVPYWMGTEFDI